jgi:hypothetical protein
MATPLFLIQEVAEVGGTVIIPQLQLEATAVQASSSFVIHLEHWQLVLSHKYSSDLF